MKLPTSSIEMLLEECPEEILKCDENGKTPLHRARSEAIAAFLLARDPEMVKVRGNDGRLPLHDLLADGFVSEQVLKAYPEAMLVEDDDGFVPIHHLDVDCCRHGLDFMVQIVDKILKTCQPEHIYVKGKETVALAYLHRLCSPQLGVAPAWRHAPRRL